MTHNVLVPSQFQPKHFLWSYQEGVATITLNRPEKKNPLTFDSYGELRDTFYRLEESSEIGAVILTGAGNNFCSGGDVHEIIAPLLGRSMPDLLAFTRLTVDLIRAMRRCPQPIIAAIDGVCVGAGAAIAMASDFRFATNRSSIAFLFTKVGLAGCDMGACFLLPRLIGLTKANELLMTGRAMNGAEALASGFLNGLVEAPTLQSHCQSLAKDLASGPRFALAMTKAMLTQELPMNIEQALEAEAQAQAICMQTNDFRRAYEAFSAKQKPRFEGN